MQKRTIFYIILVCFVLYFAVYFSSQAVTQSKGLLRVVFLDIGQGDAIYIEAPNGNQMLIDGGKTGNTLISKLKEVLPAGDTSIDTIIATHPDADHIGGLSSVIKEYTVGTFIEPGITSSTKVYQSLLTSVADSVLPHMYARTGTEIVIDKEDVVLFTVLSPDEIRTAKDTNTASIVGLLSYGEKTFLLTGDAPIEVESKIIKSGKNIHATILKLGHHGSRTSSSEAFLRAVQPDEVVISAGCNNTYGHPHKEVIDRLALLHIPSVATCTSGTIEYDTDGILLDKKIEK